MLPYPALAIGNATAVQMGNAAVAAACLPLLWTSWRGRPFHLYFVLLAPLLLASLIVTFTGAIDEPSLPLKSTIVWAMSLTGMLFMQRYAPRFGREILCGIAVATLLHAAVGAWQAYAFAHDTFPLVEVYRNPSFLSVQDNAETIARWTKRPFGLFPEPSAMSACLSPWLVLCVALLADLVRLRTPLARVHRLLFAAAAVGAVGLMILSRSGQTAVTLVALFGLCGLWLLRARATPRNGVVVTAALALVVPAVVWLAAQSVGDRLGGASLGNSSWEERASSIVAATRLFSEAGLKTYLGGFGPGLTSHAVTQEKGLEALWSVSLGYLYDTGLIGAGAILWVGAVVLRNWSRVRFGPVFAAVLLVWLVGVTITTSYEQLLPMWMALGLLTVWPEVLAPASLPERGR
jgi:hypothetical protein